MKLTVLNSSSSGNGYVLQNETEAIVIECGCKIDQCLEVLGFNTSKINACLVTHEHGDHAKYIEKYMEFMPVYCSNGTANAIKYKKIRRPKVVGPLQKFRVGNFEIMAFDTQHDCAEPFGFLIKHPEIGLLLFATDTYYLKYKFDGLTNIMLECNYDLDSLQDSYNKAIVCRKQYNRTLESHMSLENCINTLKANDLTCVSQIVLLHSSFDNSEELKAIKAVEMAIGKRVLMANKGLVITMNITPF